MRQAFEVLGRGDELPLHLLILIDVDIYFALYLRLIPLCVDGVYDVSPSTRLGATVAAAFNDQAVLVGAFPRDKVYIYPGRVAFIWRRHRGG